MNRRDAKAQSAEKELSPCSEEFMDAVCDGGTAVGDCELCGRTHFATLDRGCFDEGELERLTAKALSDSKRYVAWNDASSVGIGTLAGYQVIWGCVCGWRKARRYEDAFLNHRQIIGRYFERLSKQAILDSKIDADIARSAFNA